MDIGGREGAGQAGSGGDGFAILTPSCPEFAPTEQEWLADPLGYLSSIRHQGELVGMVKIKVPAGWEPQRFLDPSKTRIKSEYQAVHELFYKDTVSSAKAFWASFNAYIATTNFPLVGVVVLFFLSPSRLSRARALTSSSIVRSPPAPEETCVQRARGGLV